MRALLFGPNAVNIFVWLKKTAVIKSSNQSQQDTCNILIVSFSIISLFHLGTFCNCSLKIIDISFDLNELDFEYSEIMPYEEGTAASKNYYFVKVDKTKRDNIHKKHTVGGILNEEEIQEEESNTLSPIDKNIYIMIKQVFLFGLLSPLLIYF